MRNHRRLTLNLPASVRAAARETGHSTLLLRTVDVSAGGALFRAERGLPVGMEVSVVLFLPLDPVKRHRYQRIAFYGTVVRSEPGHFAVAFAGTGQAARLQALAEPEGILPDILYSLFRRPDKERT